MRGTGAVPSHLPCCAASWTEWSYGGSTCVPAATPPGPARVRFLADGFSRRGSPSRKRGPRRSRGQVPGAAVRVAQSGRRDRSGEAQRRPTRTADSRGGGFEGRHRARLAQGTRGDGGRHRQGRGPHRCVGPADTSRGATATPTARPDAASAPPAGRRARTRPPPAPAPAAWKVWSAKRAAKVQQALRAEEAKLKEMLDDAAADILALQQEEAQLRGALDRLRAERDARRGPGGGGGGGGAGARVARGVPRCEGGPRSHSFTARRATSSPAAAASRPSGTDSRGAASRRPRGTARPG